MKILKKLKNIPKALLVTISLALAVLIYCNGNPTDIVKSSVMVTNVAGTSGGTGIILESGDHLSTILTNSHVCHVVEKGGKVSGSAGTFMVATYKRSQTYDLCLITVDGNLRAHTNVADSAPTPYYERVRVSGHPALYPNVVTTGHFSGRQIIAIMTGLKPCTVDQQQDPNTAFLCAFVGGIPIVHQYDAQLVTATIMPGSSGSGVYNERNELSGVIFAGQGDLGYGWIMPYESVKIFLEKEAATLEKIYPENNVDIFSGNGEKKGFNEDEALDKMREGCSNENKTKLKGVCNLVNQDMIWRK
jgi:S1-C subfamily serine protease